MTEEDWPGKKMRSNILMDNPVKTVFKGDADVENLYRTDSFRGFKSDTFF